MAFVHSMFIVIYFPNSLYCADIAVMVDMSGERGYIASDLQGPEGKIETCYVNMLPTMMQFCS